MKRDTLLEYILEQTGQELNKDYYFIFGTQHPFYNEIKGMLSGANREGFAVVKKPSKEEKWFTISKDNLSTYQDDIVKFLGKVKL
jgi:hypothetical protein